MTTGRHRVVHGRHRKPVPPRATSARVALAGTAFAAPFGMPLLGMDAAAAAEGPPGGWGAIVHCESGGNPKASNGSHFGLFQFDLPTWRSVGGQGHPLNASPAAQVAAANRLYAARRLTPWTASQSCWAGSSRPLTVRGGAAPARAVAAPKVKPRAATIRPVPKPAPRRASAPAVSRRLHPHPVVAAHSHRVLRGETVLKIARANHVPWRSVRGFRSEDPNLIYPGELLRWA